jgi:flagellar secretion chaperone FliS
VRLTHANLHNDVQALEECARLMEPVHAAWVEIGPRVTATAQ